MFDFDAGKLLIVGVIALIFIPPKDLPRVLREVGQFVGRMRRMASDFQGQFMDAMREADIADVRREAQKLADSARVDIGFDAIHDLDRQMVAKRPEPPPEPAVTPSQPELEKALEPEAKPETPVPAPSHTS